MSNAFRALTAVVLIVPLACGGGAEEVDTDASPPEDDTAAAADTNGEFIPDVAGSFPDPIENDPCALVDATTVTELTGVEATTGEVGDVYVESYGQRYTSCTYRPVETGVVGGATFFGYELHHPVDDVAEIRNAVLGRPDAVSLEGAENVVMIGDRAWIEIDDTAIDVRCGACDRQELARAAETLVERYRSLDTNR